GQQTLATDSPDLTTIIQGLLKKIATGNMKTQWQCRPIRNSHCAIFSDYYSTGNGIDGDSEYPDIQATDVSEMDVAIVDDADAGEKLTAVDDFSAPLGKKTTTDDENQTVQPLPHPNKQPYDYENDEDEDEADEADERDDDFRSHLEDETTINLDEESDTDELLKLNSNLETDDDKNYFNQDRVEDDFDEFSLEFLDEIQTAIEENELIEETSEEDTNKITLWRKARMIASSLLLYAEWP